MTDINRGLHEVLGRCWHDIVTGMQTDYGYCRHCRKHKQELLANPDFKADPRLVIAALREQGTETINAFEQMLLQKVSYLSFIDLIMDKTGKLALLAWEWIKQQKGERQ